MKWWRILRAPLVRLYETPFRWLESRGVELERHPLAWVPAALAILVGLPFLFVGLMVLAVVLPLFGVLQFFGFWHFSRSAARLRVAEPGLEIYNKKGTLFRSLSWSEIASVERIFDPPLVFVQLRLQDGETLDLHDVDVQWLSAEIARRGIPGELDLKAARKR